MKICRQIIEIYLALPNETDYLKMSEGKESILAEHCVPLFIYQVLLEHQKV
jgi:hypothetical protein